MKKMNVDHIPADAKWGMAAKGLTGALSAHLNAIHELAGKEKYAELMSRIWSQIGKGSAEEIKASGAPADNAKQVAEAGVAVCMAAMGPEYTIEQVEADDDRTVMKIIECPWNNRLKDFGTKNDIMSACDVAFWKEFVKTLNPKVTMRHGKQMHMGAPYCEWIFEAKK